MTSFIIYKNEISNKFNNYNKNGYYINGILDLEQYLSEIECKDILPYANKIDKIIYLIYLYNYNCFFNDNIKEVREGYKKIKLIRNLAQKHISDFKKIKFVHEPNFTLFNPNTNEVMIEEDFSSKKHNEYIKNKYVKNGIIYINTFICATYKEINKFERFLKDNNITLDEFIANDKIIVINISNQILNQLKELNILNENEIEKIY